MNRDGARPLPKPLTPSVEYITEAASLNESDFLDLFSCDKFCFEIAQLNLLRFFARSASILTIGTSIVPDLVLVYIVSHLSAMGVICIEVFTTYRGCRMAAAAKPAVHPFTNLVIVEPIMVSLLSRLFMLLLFLLIWSWFIYWLGSPITLRKLKLIDIRTRVKL